MKKAATFFTAICLLFPALTFSQESSGEKLARKVVDIIKSGNPDGLKPLQAIPDIYRKIAASQMKGKSDQEIMETVNNPDYSIYARTQEIINSLTEAGLDPAKLTFTKVNIEKFELIAPEYNVLRTFCKYDNAIDTLIFESFNKAGKWYLVDLANDDRQLANIIKIKGKIDPQKLFEKGLDAIQSDDWGKAVEYFTRATEINPKFKEAYYKCTFSYIELGKFDLAESTIKKAIEIDKNYADAYVELGYINERMKNYDAAKSNLDFAIKLDSTKYWAYYYAGNMYADLGDYENAAFYLSGAIRNNPSKYYNPYKNRASAYFKLKQYSLAKEDYLQVIEIEPQVAEAYYYIGWIENDFEKYESALKYLEKYLTYEPDQLDALYERGFANKKLNKFKEAISDFDQVLAVLEKTPSTSISLSKLYKHLADSYFGAGNTDSACGYYKKAIDEGDDASRELSKERCK